MRTKNILCLVIILLLSLFTPVSVYAEEAVRNIYIGDIITLEIAAGNISSEELREKFRDFEIVDIKKESNIYLISLRTFEPGEYSVSLGNKEVIVNVASTLDDIARDGIFYGGTDIIDSGFSLHWRVFLCISAGIFAVSGGIILIKMTFKRKEKLLSPYQRFMKNSDAIELESESFFVDLTLCFKEYLEQLYQCRIIGKTSSEIVNEVKDIITLGAVMADIEEWLTECDRLKFTGITVTDDKKQEHCDELLYLVKKIETQTGDAQKEGAA